MQRLRCKIADIRVISEKSAAEQWSFSGTASTPTPDRQNDTVDPLGAKFTLPLPLLWQHSADMPIGHVVSATVSKDGIAVEGQITRPTDDMPPGMSGRLREAWSSLKAGLVRGLSIGFIPREFSPNKSGGFDISAWDWLELSAVTIPANGDATVSAIKSVNPPTVPARGGFALRVPTIQLRT